jgi:hypothetical protein
MSYNPYQTNQSVSGVTGASIIGLPYFGVAGSVATVGTAVANQSVSGIVGASIIGLPYFGVAGSVATVGTTANQSVSGSVGIVGTPSISGAVTIVGNPSVSGTVNVLTGTSSVITTNVGSVITVPGAGWSGSVIAQIASSVLVAPTTTWPGSVAAHIKSGSIIALMGNTSIVAIASTLWPGSVAAYVKGGTVSIAGIVYAEDTAHTSGDPGMFSLRIRNDTMSSVTSADGDYSPDTVGPIGETIVSNSPITKWVQGNVAAVGGTQQTIISAGGASIFTYITAIQVANSTATAATVTFMGATSSIVGYTVAPASGGSNVYMQNGMKTNANGAFSASISTYAASVLISAEGFISKT